MLILVLNSDFNDVNGKIKKSVKGLVKALDCEKKTFFDMVCVNAILRILHIYKSLLRLLYQKKLFEARAKDLASLGCVETSLVES